MQDYIGPISQVGFPIVVALLLLIRIESAIAKLREQIATLTETIIKLTTIIDERIDK